MGVQPSATPSNENKREPLVVIASNRGPYNFRRKRDGSFATRRGEGGLVTALSAVADTAADVLWVAAALSKDDVEWAKQQEDKTVKLDDMSVRLLVPDRRKYRLYYNQISNPLLWFIQHQMWDAAHHPVITAETWTAWKEGYVSINRLFAQTIIDSISEEDADRPILVFPQDYHLYLVPHFLRQKLGDRVQIQPFIHIPWPGPDAWQILPSEMRTMMLTSLLESDRVGFQTKRDAFNFVQTCRIYVPDAHSGGSRTTIEYKGRKTYARAYPISIDVEKVESLTKETDTVKHRTHFDRMWGKSDLILRIDRIEPSKNILRGLLAYRTLLENYPEHHGKAQMLALLVPSRLEVDEYKTYLAEVMAEAGMINATFSDEKWEPVRLIIGNNYARAIAALQLYKVLLVNPINDGMNLVAKEGALVNERDGVLILSENAGAFYELGDHALTISPYDVYSTAEALHEALIMPQEERSKRAEALRAQIKGGGVKAWFKQQIHDAMSALTNASSQSSTPTTPLTSVSAEL